MEVTRLTHCQADDALLDKLQRDTFQYFVRETNPANGLVPDSTKQDTAQPTDRNRPDEGEVYSF